MNKDNVLGDLTASIKGTGSIQGVPVTRRQGIISDPLVIDWDARVVDVEIGNSGLSSPIPFADEVFPVAGASCWIDFTGASPLVVHTQYNTDYTLWTPTFTNFPAGTSIAEYKREGNECRFSLQYLFTGGLAAAPMSFTLPFVTAGAGGNAVGKYLRNGVRHFSIVGTALPGSASMALFTDLLTTGTTGEMTGTNPATIANTDYLMLSGAFHC